MELWLRVVLYMFRIKFVLFEKVIDVFNRWGFFYFWEIFFILLVLIWIIYYFFFIFWNVLEIKLGCWTSIEMMEESNDRYRDREDFGLVGSISFNGIILII